jgi:iron complex outermembrane receptor protein
MAALGATLPCMALADGAPTGAAASAPAAAAAAVTQVEQIVVTAQRRSEDLQRAPLAVTAVQGRQLDQSFITTVAGLNAQVPSLEVTKASGFENLVTIRGVGSETPENSLTTVPGVSEFIDGVYIANTISLDQTLFDINNIQVLRGPQGALYGESSIGGALILETNQPKLHELSGTADFSAGDYSLYRERAEVNAPLGDDAAVRVSAQKYDHQGFTNDAAIPGFHLDDAHDVSGKVALLWKPTDHFSATFTAQGYYSDQHGDAQKNINDPATNPRVVNQDYPAHFSLTTQLYHLNLVWDLPWFELRSVTGYQDLNHIQHEDSSRSTYALIHGADPHAGYDDIAAWNTAVHDWTEEFDILSLPGSKLEWIGGVFYMNQTSHQFIVEYEGTTPPTPAQLAIPPNIEQLAQEPSNLSYGNDSHATHQSYAAFAQASYHITPAFRVTAGGRINLDNNTDPSFNFSAFGKSHAFNQTWNSVPTWRAEADYDLTAANMIYVSAARGYKPGAANGDSGQFVVPAVAKPETNTAFEIGTKNSFFDRTLRVNASAFYYIHDNFQYIETDPKPFDGGIANIPRVDDYGAEVEISYVDPDNRLHLNTNLAFERGEIVGVYKTIDSTVANYLQGPDFTGGNSDNFDAAHAYGACAFYAAYSSPACWAAVKAMAVNVQGKTPPAMPTVSGSVSLSYRFDVPYGVLTPRAEVVYRGSEWARIFNDPALDRVPAYTVTNLNADFVPTGTRLRLSLTATNVFNVAGVNSRYTDPYGTFQTSQQYIPPRQVIGTIAYAF